MSWFSSAENAKLKVCEEFKEPEEDEECSDIQVSLNPSYKIVYQAKVILDISGFVSPSETNLNVSENVSLGETNPDVPF